MNYQAVFYLNKNKNSFPGIMVDAAVTAPVRKPRARWGAFVICVCETSYDPSRKYVECRDCEAIFHVECMGFADADAPTLEAFRCWSCNPAAMATPRGRIRRRALPPTQPVEPTKPVPLPSRQQPVRAAEENLKN